jgi:hypothetical protein
MRLMVNEVEDGERGEDGETAGAGAWRFFLTDKSLYAKG